MKHAKTNELFLFVSVAIIQNFDGGIHDKTTPLKKYCVKGHDMVIRKKILETHDEMIHTQDVLLDDSFNWMLILKTRFFQPSFFYKKLDIYIFMFFFSSYIKEVFFFSILSLSIQYY
jgi:hypothetical protein